MSEAKPRVLFLCIANSARSQIAEGVARARFGDRIAKELAEHGTLRPPWIAHPEIPRRSIGWRMGGGEWYLWMWQRWWEQQDAAARDAYRARWEPPSTWRDWLR